MHIDNDKLVGTYVSDKYSEKGTVTIVLTDGDSTPTREYTRYKYVQTEQLTAIGVAVKDYGAVLVPETTIELFTNGTLNPADFGVFVKFNDDYYSISLSSLLGKDIGASIEFGENSFDDYPTVTFNATLPPYSVGNAGQVPTVDENGKVGWDDIPEELPSVTGNTGKFLGVNDDATGVEWKNVPKEMPTAASASAGDILSLDENKEPVWLPPSSKALYIHNLKFSSSSSSNTYKIEFQIVNDVSTPYTSGSVVAADVYSKAGQMVECAASGYRYNSSTKRVYCAARIGSNGISYEGIDFQIINNAISFAEASDGTIGNTCTDTVIPI